jgi:hypothetical protein
MLNFPMDSVLLTLLLTSQVGNRHSRPPKRDCYRARDDPANGSGHRVSRAKEQSSDICRRRDEHLQSAPNPRQVPLPAHHYPG